MNSSSLNPTAAGPLGQAEIAAIARKQEDVMINDELIARHKAGVRLAHWTLAVFFFLATLTGFVIYTPYLPGWRECSAAARWRVFCTRGFHSASSSAWRFCSATGTRG